MSPSRPSPFEYAPETWPEGPFTLSKRGNDKDLVTAETLGEIVIELQRQMDASRMNATMLCEQADVSRSTLYELLQGTTWADLTTVVSLMRTLNGRLEPRWNGEPPLPTRS